MLIMKIRPATVDDVEAIAAVIEPFVDYVVVTEEGRERFKPDMLKNIFQQPLIVKLLYYSYRIRKKLEITHRLNRSTILYAYV